MTDESSDDIWLNSLAAFPDVRPLAQLLRSNAPMSAAVRKLLAELLLPQDPPIERFILEPKLNKDFDKMLRKLDVVSEYRMATGSGASSELAAGEAGTKQNITGRQVFRYLKEDLPQKLGERLRGKDDPEDN